MNAFKTLRLPLFSALLAGMFASAFLSASAGAHDKDKSRWNQKYENEVYIFGREPIPFLKNNVGLLPKGRALDLAMGEGRNGVYLATQGFEVVGIDISEKGLQKAHRLAKANGTTIETRVADLESIQLEKGVYDVALCAYYMQRDLFAQMKDSLKSGGMVVVETYNTDYLKYRSSFRREWALEENELLEIFKDYKIIRYQIYDDGEEAYSSIIAQKP